MFRSLLVATTFLFLAQALYAGSIHSVQTAFQCGEERMPEHILAHENIIRLAPEQIWNLDPPYVTAAGRLGWHITWVAIFDDGRDGLVVFETLGMEGDHPEAFGRIAVPKTLQEALADCGVKWGGDWSGAWPEAELSTNVENTSRGLLPPAE